MMNDEAACWRKMVLDWQGLVETWRMWGEIRLVEVTRVGWLCMELSLADTTEVTSTGLMQLGRPCMIIRCRLCFIGQKLKKVPNQTNQKKFDYGS